VDKARDYRKTPGLPGRQQKPEELVMEDDDYFEPQIGLNIIISSVDENDPESVAAELDRIRQVIAHPADYDCGFYICYEFLAEHFGWKKMSNEKLTIYHELTRGVPLEAVSADILDSIPFSQEELDNYWYAYGFVDYPLGFLVMRVERVEDDLKAAKRLDLWREFFIKNLEELERNIQDWESGSHDFDEASPLRFFYEVKFNSNKEAREKELNRIRAVIANPMDYIAPDKQFYLVYEYLAEHYGWKKMPTAKLIIYEELTRFIPLELAGPDILGSFSFDKKELADYHEAFDFYHYPLNLLSEDGTDERLDLWREFFKKHSEELVKELKHEEDFHRKNPDYRPRLKAWFYDEE
jgi:hypothetical protein